MDIQTYVVSRVLPAAADRMRGCLQSLAGPAPPSYPLADLNSLLTSLSPSELREAIAAAPQVELSPFLANYVAAMVETVCAKRAVPVPAWTRAIAPLDEPYFGSALQSLRLHLLTHSPAAFRRRNIFIDSTLGDRV